MDKISGQLHYISSTLGLLHSMHVKAATQSDECNAEVASGSLKEQLNLNISHSQNKGNELASNVISTAVV